MRRHDLSGYLAVLTFRTSRTILVEGRTDKRALSRALHELERAKRIARGSIVVDSAEDIDSPEPSIGNRDFVHLLLTRARAEGLDVYGLVDREFERFVATAAEFRDDVRCHHHPAPDLFWTRGHSLENYFFEPGYVQEFLRFRYSAQVPLTAIEEISKFWTDALANVAALSVAARNAGLLTRLRGGFEVGMWEVKVPSSIALVEDRLEQLALARGVAPDTAKAFRVDFGELLRAARACSDPECTRWIAHGHIADEAMWFAVARILLHAGVDRSVAGEVGCGYREEKSLHREERWAVLHQACSSACTPTPLWLAVGVKGSDSTDHLG